MTKPPRIRRFPGQQTWTLAQEAYLAGESARSIAARLDLTENGIRKRAARKGWTRTRHAEALKRSEHPGQALSALIARIGRMLHEGRVEEAAALTPSAEALARAVRAAPPGPPLQPSPEVMKAWREAETRRLEAYWGPRARAMAEALLRETGYDIGDRWAASALRWRARVLGPEQAALDFARGVSGGWAERYWDVDGTLWPARPPASPDGRMQRQHAWLAGARRECGMDWTEEV
ncbi:hypothetical protein [Brevundimonas sp.]|uniref:hypothetical protein n=1 Tax=Brevundimonas sp. TaxID=1871086 RepID=UPI002D5CF1C5|nr:hypothetical protein [Brevundimonas sp.]HYC96575.1 hypothetical protein [Brevundimonas sp.]